MYAYCIGQCGIKPDEYWRLTEAETIAIIAGHQRLKSYDSENYRNIYGAMVKHFGAKQPTKTLWPLPTDYDTIEANKEKLTKEYLQERNENMIEVAKKYGFLKGKP